jgi:hypothetical protein
MLVGNYKGRSFNSKASSYLCGNSGPRSAYRNSYDDYDDYHDDWNNHEHHCEGSKEIEDIAKLQPILSLGWCFTFGQTLSPYYLLRKRPELLHLFDSCL